MTKAELKELAKKHDILDCDTENAIEFIEDLLVSQANEIENRWPYATKTIWNLRNAASEVYELFEYVDAAMEE